VRWKIQIFGERCSGTNYLESLVSTNVRNAEIGWEFGWKHFFPHGDPAAAADTVFLVIYRHPFRWLQSLHRNPWHVAPHLRGRSFAEFIRSEWMCVYDESSNTPPSDPRYGQEMLFERDPRTGERFANVLHLRSAKIRAWQAIGEQTPRFLFLRYEDLDAQPERALRTIQERLGLQMRRRLQIPTGYKGKMSLKQRVKYAWSGGTKGGFQRPQYTEIAAQDQAFIVQNLDLRLEHEIGYLLDYH
jgi:hypothetical protein